MGSRHTMAVFAPVLQLTVTIEASSSGVDEVHIHPGGQGFWVARMLRHLNEYPILCAPVGGEPGQALPTLLQRFEIEISAVESVHSSPVVVSDRRSGERVIIAERSAIVLERHEIDDFYGRFLDKALEAGLCVITGQPEEIVSPDFYRRLSHDLAAAEVEVVADLHGPELRAFLEGGPIRTLKVSHDDLLEDGVIGNGDDDSLMTAMRDLSEAGAHAIVASRQQEPTIAVFGDRWFEARTPELDPADHRGAGDSMTAGLAAGLRRGLKPEAVLQLACAAGAANVTRHGLGSADSGLIPELTEKVRVRQLSASST